MAEKKQYECNISPDLLASWQKLKRHGDTETMAKEFGVSYPVIQRALNHGFVTISDLSAKITNFFSERLTTESIAAQSLNELSEQSNFKSNGTTKRAKSGK